MAVRPKNKSGTSNTIGGQVPTDMIGHFDDGENSVQPEIDTEVWVASHHCCVF